MLESERQWREEYNAYISSPEWRARRLAKLEDANERCERCLCRPDRLEVHHKTYKNWRNEPPEDLEALCEECHEAEHDRKVTP